MNDRTSPSRSAPKRPLAFALAAALIAACDARTTAPGTARNEPDPAPSQLTATRTTAAPPDWPAVLFADPAFERFSTSHAWARAWLLGPVERTPLGQVLADFVMTHRGSLGPVELEQANILAELVALARLPEAEIARLERSAAGGDPAACRAVGLIRWRGLGRPADANAALALLEHAYAETGDPSLAFLIAQVHAPCANSDWKDWYERAAWNGHAASMMRLAHHYASAPKTNLAALTEAAAWHGRAAAAGEPSAMFRLARAYERGLGVAQNPFAAARLYRAAADAGYTDAMTALAELLYAHPTLAHTPKEGCNWAMRAALAGDADAEARLDDTLLKYGLDAPTRRKIAEAQRRRNAHLELWYAFVAHVDPEIPDGKEAEALLRASKLGSAAGHYGLGLCYSLGRGVPADPDAARRSFERAAAGGVDAARAAVAWLDTTAPSPRSVPTVAGASQD